MAAALGSVTAKYRWFAIFYLIFMFLILPLLVFTLSMIGVIAFYTVSIPFASIAIMAFLLNLLQGFKPELLPAKYRTWAFLPLWFHSLEPYDRIVQHLIHFCKEKCCYSCYKPSDTSSDVKTAIISKHYSSSAGLDNLAFTHVLATESYQCNFKQTQV